MYLTISKEDVLMNLGMAVFCSLVIIILVNLILAYVNFRDWSESNLTNSIYKYIKLGFRVSNIPRGFISFAFILFINGAIAPIYLNEARPGLYALYQIILIITCAVIGANMIASKARSD